MSEAFRMLEVDTLADTISVFYALITLRGLSMNRKLSILVAMVINCDLI